MGLEKPTPIIDDYLANKSSRREQLAQDLGVDVRTAKQIITAIFNGAPTSNNGSIARDIVSNRLVIARLKHNTWIQALKRDLKALWRSVGVRKSTEKAAIYRKEERRVMSSVIQYLKRQRQIGARPVRYFLEHDGWRSDTPVELYQLSLWVKNRTGYAIRFSEELVSEEIL